MTRRGLTLLELLLAIGLLSGLGAVSIGWTTSSASSARVIQERSRWHTAAMAALDQLGEDLRCGDVLRRELGRDALPAWISIEEGRIKLQGRAAPYSGDERVRYELDSGSGLLSRVIGAEDSEQAESRILLGEVTRVSARLLPSPQAERFSASLSVELVSRSGWTAGREYRLESSVQP